MHPQLGQAVLVLSAHQCDQQWLHLLEHLLRAQTLLAHSVSSGSFVRWPGTCCDHSWLGEPGPTAVLCAGPV